MKNLGIIKMSLKNSNSSGYLSLCYHYIRDNYSRKQFPRIMGTTENQFINHIKMFSKNFKLIEPDQAILFSYDDFVIPSKDIGLLLTFDDGLSDHYLAAKILKKFEIKAIFFIPTCIIKDEQPANPIIIHYCIAKYGITSFLKNYNLIIENDYSELKNYKIFYKNNLDNPYEIINKIKFYFKYSFDEKISRQILLRIYEIMFKNEFPNALKLMHLTKDQISEMIDMGHTIGTHSHSHISLGSSRLTKKEILSELIGPQKYLNDFFGIDSKFISYPFGDIRDCLKSKQLLKKTKSYRLAFTVEEKLNTKNSSPLELGRYMPTSTDTTEKLLNKMRSIIKK